MQYAPTADSDAEFIDRLKLKEVDNACTQN